MPDRDGSAEGDYAPRRIAVYAHYDRHHKIDDYVLYYLAALREVAEKVIFASDSALPEAEISKLAGLAECVHAANHGEYDFGSWKRALAACARNLPHYDELILANDSCYGPVKPLQEVFDLMSRKNTDFWGITQHEGLMGYPRHLQSYFLVFRRQVFRSKVFQEFFRSVQKCSNKKEVIRRYEVNLTRTLSAAGFRWDSLVPFRPGDNPTIAQDTVGRLPLIKVALLRDNPLSAAFVHLWQRSVRDHHLQEAVYRHLQRLCETRRHWRWHLVVPRLCFAPLGRHGPIFKIRQLSPRIAKLRVGVFGIGLFHLPLPVLALFRRILEANADFLLRLSMKIQKISGHADQ